MEKTLFMEQMEENTHFNLIYPFHINHDKKIGRKFFNETDNAFHEHDFPSVLKNVYLEPNAFYLTDGDKQYYSAQEIEFIEKVRKCEQEKLNNGFEMISLELEEETIAYINMYKEKHNCTTEDAINMILREIVEHYSNA